MTNDRKEYTHPVMSIDEFLNRSNDVDEFDVIIGSLATNDDLRSIASASTCDVMSRCSFETDVPLDLTVFPSEEEISGRIRQTACIGPRKSVFVRFASDEHGEVLCTVHPFAGYTRSQRKSIWYQPRDFIKFKKKVHSKLGAPSSDFLSTYSDIRRVCEARGSGNGGVDDEIMRKAPIRIAESKYRGIEPFLYESIMNDRKCIVKKILNKQQQWTALGPMVTEDERALAIAELSHELTRPYRKLAHLLGSGDAAIARRLAWRQARTQDKTGLLEI